MHESNQTPGGDEVTAPGGAPSAGPDTSRAAEPPSASESTYAPLDLASFGAPEPLHPGVPTTRVALLVWLALLLAFGIGGIVLHQQELALLAAFAGVFVAANVADVDPQWRELYYALGWTVPFSGVAGGAALLLYLARSELPVPLRVGLAVIAALACGIGLASTFTRPADALARALFGDERPGHLSRVSVRAVVLVYALAIPGWFAAQDVLAEMLRDPAPLLDKAGLGGGLIGYVLLAFAGVGWLVRRNFRDAAARLGLRVPTLSDVLVAALAVAALWLLNGGADLFQHRWFPELWRSDRRVTDSIASGMGPARVILLGLSAGIGEEITLRGALQPKLGVLRTAVFFAALHVQYSWFGMAAIFLLGVVLGEVRRRTSTTSAILAHAAYDMLAVVIH